MAEPTIIPKAVILSQAKRLQLLGWLIMTLAVALEGLACAIVYHSGNPESSIPDPLQGFLEGMDPTSCTMMAVLFAVMALFALGGAWQKRMYIS